MPICGVSQCERRAEKRGWCPKHYQRWQKHGDPTGTLRNRVDGTPEERFWANANQAEGCWLWLGEINDNGYGCIWTGKRRERAHRFGYELTVGPIPEGLDLDHLCRVRKCVNPDHLEPVTRQVNILRGETLPAAQVKRTHCPQGHEYSPENTRMQGRIRHCRQCDRDYDRTRRPRVRRAS